MFCGNNEHWYFSCAKMNHDVSAFGHVAQCFRWENIEIESGAFELERWTALFWRSLSVCIFFEWRHQDKAFFFSFDKIFFFCFVKSINIPWRNKNKEVFFSRKSSQRGARKRQTFDSWQQIIFAFCYFEFLMKILPQFSYIFHFLFHFLAVCSERKIFSWQLISRRIFHRVFCLSCFFAVFFDCVEEKCRGSLYIVDVTRKFWKIFWQYFLNILMKFSFKAFREPLKISQKSEIP